MAGKSGPWAEPADGARVIVLMGVSGSGKTTVGKLLSRELHWPFYDGDDFQPQGNIAKMKEGFALNDQDREPWLLALRNLLQGIARSRGKAVLACSVLKEVHRRVMAGGVDGIQWVLLRGSFRLIEQRLKSRKGHFFKAGLLPGQFEILEAPEDAVIADISRPPGDIVADIRASLGLA